MSDTTRRDPILRRILADVADAPTTVRDGTAGLDAPIDAAAAATLRQRLLTVARMHQDNELTDAQLLAVVPDLAAACAATSVLRHALTPQQREASRLRAIDAFAGALTDEDIRQLYATTG